MFTEYLTNKPITTVTEFIENQVMMAFDAQMSVELGDRWDMLAFIAHANYHELDMFSVVLADKARQIRGVDLPEVTS